MNSHSLDTTVINLIGFKKSNLNLTKFKLKNGQWTTDFCINLILQFK